MQLRRDDKSKKITLVDVARHAGVSAITVSRALRQPDKVSKNLRTSILRIVEELQYVPDSAARALASRDSGVIGVLVPNLSHTLLISFVRGIEERVLDTQFRVQYANTHYDAQQERFQMNKVLAQSPMGIIVAGVQDEENLLNLISRADCPILHTIDINLKPNGGVAAIDHEAAAMTATRHLVACGYRRIGMLSAGRDLRTRLRTAGFVQVLSKAGLFDTALTVNEDAPTSVHLGCRMLRQLIERDPSVDAVFCHNDDIALGTLFEAQRLGLRVPEDFGICGFQDLDFASSAEPPLTTVRVPRFEIGYRAVDMLIHAHRTGASLQDLPSVDLGFQLVERRTTRPVT